MPGSRLSLLDRVEIQCGIARRLSDQMIGGVIGKNRTTVLREVRACGGRDGYRADTAQARSCRNAKRPKTRKLAADPVLNSAVQAGLVKRWSPAAISMALTRAGGATLSAETIYAGVYSGAVGPLGPGFVRLLPSARRTRRCRTRRENAKRNVLGPIRPISERPSAAAAVCPATGKAISSSARTTGLRS